MSTSEIGVKSRQLFCRLCLAPENECVSIYNNLSADKQPLQQKISSCVQIKVSNYNILFTGWWTLWGLIDSGCRKVAKNKIDNLCCLGWLYKEKWEHHDHSGATILDFFTHPYGELSMVLVAVSEEKNKYQMFDSASDWRSSRSFGIRIPNKTNCRKTKCSNCFFLYNFFSFTHSLWLCSECGNNKKQQHRRRQSSSKQKRNKYKKKKYKTVHGVVTICEIIARAVHGVGN